MTRLSLQALAATRRGPLHARDNMSNQDATRIIRGAFGTAIVACDGMGSMPEAAAGAAAACRAVGEALHRWSRASCTSKTLIRVIHAYWELHLGGIDPRTAGTTCLFAAALSDGRLILGRLGDGLVAWRMPGMPGKAFPTERESFGNLTTGLGVTRSFSDWTLHEEAEMPPGSVVLIATDGVADDLEMDRMDDLLDYLTSRYDALPKRRRRAVLERELDDWQTPHHLDDKTLALLWNPERRP